MSNPPSRRRLKRFLCLAAALACCAVVAVLARAEIERRQWRDFCAAQADLAARLAAPAEARERFVEATEEGDAWDSYRSAENGIQVAIRAGRFTFRKPRDPIDGLMTLATGLPPSEDLLKHCPAALSDLRAAARRRLRAVPGRESPFADARTARVASDLLLLSANKSAQSWDPASAVEDIATALQLEQDLDGSIRSFEELEALRDLTTGQELPDPLLLRIEQMLLRIESGIPGLPRSLELGRTQLGDFIASGSTLTLPRDFRAAPHELWRNGFSLKLAVCEADRRAERLVRQASEIERMDWERANLKFKEWHAGRPEAPDPNPVVREFDLDARTIEMSLRHFKAYLRLLRAAVMSRRGLGPASPGWPADPWDLAPLRRRETPDEWILWTGGPDGAGIETEGGVGYEAAPGRYYLSFHVPRKPR